MPKFLITYAVSRDAGSFLVEASSQQEADDRAAEAILEVVENASTVQALAISDDLARDYTWKSEART